MTEIISTLYNIKNIKKVRITELLNFSSLIILEDINVSQAWYF